MGTSLQMRVPYFHVGVVVADLDAAAAELTSALGVQIAGPQVRHAGEIQLRAAMGLTAPPYIELIEGVDGSLWEATTPPTIHHLGCWSEDLDADGSRLERAGIRLEQDLGVGRFYGPAPETGLRFELIDAGYRDQYLDRWRLPRGADR
jgi:hypothetical protein